MSYQPGLRIPKFPLPPVQTARIRNFSGGLDIRDAPSELALSESPSAYNVTLDERGGVNKRLGFIKFNGSAFNASKVANTWYSTTLQKQITQSGTDLFPDASTVSFKTFTTSERVGFADFNGKLWIIHPTDGLFQSDGTAGGTALVAGGPKGSCIVPVQNRLVAYDIVNNQLAASKIGDGTDWTTGAGHGWTNKIWEKDREPVVALALAPGTDVLGRPGLLAFKRRSAYRVYDFSDATGGAYTTIDWNVGAASALAIAGYSEKVILISERGIFYTNGTGALKPAWETSEPLWQPAQVAYDQIDKWCAGWKGDRIYFSLCRAGSTQNDLALEYHPQQGWIVPGSNAASCYATYQKNDQKLLTGSPGANGQVYEQQHGGSDDGAAIASRFQTRWFEPNDGFLTRMRRIRVIGRGAFSLYLRKDFHLSNDDLLSVNVSGTAGLYDDAAAVYDAAGALYGPLSSQDYQDFQSPGVCKAISFRVEETSTISSTGPQLLESGTAPEIGAWALYGIDLNHVRLGLA